MSLATASLAANPPAAPYIRAMDGLAPNGELSVSPVPALGELRLATGLTAKHQVQPHNDGARRVIVTAPKSEVSP